MPKFSPHSIAPGMSVRMKTPLSPVMVVSYVRGNFATCWYFNKTSDAFMRVVLPTVTLKQVEQ